MDFGKGKEIEGKNEGKERGKKKKNPKLCKYIQFVKFIRKISILSKSVLFFPFNS